MTISEWEDILGPWVRNDVLLVTKFLNRGDVYFDIGANTGLFTQLIINELNQDYKFFDKIVLFEPIKKYSDECIKKFKNYDHIKVEQIALSDDNTEKKLLASRLNYGYNKIFHETMEIHPHDEYVVKPITFSQWIKTKKYPKVDFIKIDTEGHDYNIIKGMFEWFKTTDNRPKILFESTWYPKEEQEVIDMMINDFGYVTIHTEDMSHNNGLLINRRDFEVFQDTYQHGHQL